MAAYRLSHITDLRHLCDDDVHRFAQELPTLVATLRQTAAAARAEGEDIREVYPSITFESESGDQVVFKTGGETRLAVDGASMRAWDEAQQALVRARLGPM